MTTQFGPPEGAYRIKHSCGHEVDHYLSGEDASEKERAEMTKDECPFCQDGCYMRLEEVDDDWLENEMKRGDRP